MTGSVTIREVLPRDGFQDLPFHLPAVVKTEVIRRLWEAGLRWIEVSSLVSPRAVPQFSDAEKVIGAARRLADLKLSVFVPNRRGLARAIGAGADEVSLAVAATDSLSQSNFSMNRADALTEIAAVTGEALAQGLEVSITIGGALGCPFEGPVPVATVVSLAEQALEAGAGSIFVADTIGAGTPDRVGVVVAAVHAALGDAPLGIHLHGGEAATAGVLSAVAAGAEMVDASLTGLGGCPFVPNAPGNVSTEAVARCLDAEGISHPLDLGRLQTASADITRMIEQARTESGVLAG
jgi:hydroxymethylglutaryl-CoA lyase